jgi:hypothetical protein
MVGELKRALVTQCANKTYRLNNDTIVSSLNQYFS